MIEGVRAWLMAVISAAVLCSAVEALMPNGGVKQVGKLVCGLVLLCVVLSPVAEPDLEGGRRWLEEYAGSVERGKKALEDQVDQGMKVIIEEEYAAYIVDKATRLGFPCAVRVTCREEEGIFLPDRVRVSGALTPEGREELSRSIRQELGVPPERQSFEDGEGQP